MTREEGRQHPIKVNYPLFNCLICAKEGCNDANHYVLTNQNICFNCHYWQGIVADKNRLLIIDGSVYSDSGWSNDNNKYLGFGGRIFNYRRLPGGQPVKTNNLWNGTPIPEIWRDLLPDNAEWTDRKREWVGIGNGQIALADVKEVVIEVVVTDHFILIAESSNDD